MSRLKDKADLATVIEHWGAFPKLQPERARQVLDALAKEQTFEAVFMRVLVGDSNGADVSSRWARSLAFCRKMGRQYSIGDAAFRQTLTLIQQPEVLAACQAATVKHKAPLVVLAGLAKDGSDGSYDALMSAFERARDGRDDGSLRYQLNRLRRYATPGPRWVAFDAAVKGELASLEARRAVNSYAKRLGLHLPLLELSVTVRATPRGWLWLHISDKHEQLSFQALEVTRHVAKVTDARKLPRVISSLGRVRWQWGDAQVRSNLKGKYRDAFISWLRGERPSPAA